MQPKIAVEEVSRAVKTTLLELYGERLVKVILYGSYARGDFHEESDIDFLVVLKDEEVQTYREISAMSLPLYRLELRFGVLISCHPMSLARFQKSDFSFVKNVRREGVAV